MIDRFQEDSEILDGLITKQLNEVVDSNKLYFLINKIRQLENISVALEDKIIKQTLLKCLEGDGYFIKSHNQKRKNIFDSEDNLYSSLAKIIMHRHLYTNFSRLFNELEHELNDERQLVNLYVLLFELKSFVRDIDSKFEFDVKKHICCTSQYIDLAKNDKHLYFLNSIQMEKVLSIEIIENYIKVFGSDLFEGVRFKFKKRIRYGGLFQIYLSRLLKEGRLKQFVTEDYSRIIKAGIEPHDFEMKFRSSHFYYFTGKNEFKELIEEYINVKSIELKHLLGMIIKQAELNNEALTEIKHKYSKGKIDEVMKLFKKKYV